MHINFADPELFGNEAGEEENAEILQSYFVDKPEFEAFYSEKNKLAIIRGRKGTGKSALLAKVAYDMSKNDTKSSLVIYAKGSDLASFDINLTQDPNQLINAWQQRICALTNLKLSEGIKFAFDDTAITIVESAELAGYRSRNLLGSLIDRFQSRIGSTKIDQQDPSQLLRRFLDKKSNDKLKLWVIIDDIDATFVNQKKQRLVLSTFFSTCRKMASDYDGIAIRTCVRSDVWNMLSRSDESLDKCEQYITDIRWSHKEAKEILVKKIYTFIQRQKNISPEVSTLTPDLHSEQLLNLVFQENFPWGKGFVSPTRPIHILSAGRPRWSAQLCKLAGAECCRNNNKLISIGHINNVMRVYGKRRLDDLYREHHHQYPELQKLIESFAGGPRRYTTDKLLLHITKKIITPLGSPLIDGQPAPDGATPLAHFIYKIGFIHGRNAGSEEAPLSFVEFHDRPDLLTNEINLDDNLSWEIHPSYRTILSMQ